MLSESVLYVSGVWGGGGVIRILFPSQWSPITYSRRFLSHNTRYSVPFPLQISTTCIFSYYQSPFPLFHYLLYLSYHPPSTVQVSFNFLFLFYSSSYWRIESTIPKKNLTEFCNCSLKQQSAKLTNILVYRHFIRAPIGKSKILIQRKCD